MLQRLRTRCLESALIIEDSDHMQKFYCIGRAEEAVGDKLVSQWPGAFVKKESDAKSTLTDKLKGAQVLKAIWFGSLDEDDKPRLIYTATGNEEDDNDRRVPIMMFNNWKREWKEAKPSKSTKLSRMEKRVAEAKERERLRKEKEEREREEAKNVYALPYEYFYAPSNHEDK